MFTTICPRWYCRSVGQKGLSLLLFLALLAAVYSQSLPRVAQAAAADHLLISEVFYHTPSGTSEEWIEIYNPTSSAIDLSPYKIGDAETASKGEGMYQFPAGAGIQAGGKIVVAREATTFFNLYGKQPDFEVSETDADVTNMVKYSAWGTSSLNLSNAGDEVLLLDESDIPVDVAVYGSGSYPEIIPHPGVDIGHSIERSPAEIDTDDCSMDFIDQSVPNPETESPVQPPPPPPPPPSLGPQYIGPSGTSTPPDNGISQDDEGNLTNSLPLQADIVHTLYLGSCEPWLDASAPMPQNWCEEHPKNELNLGGVSPLLPEGADGFQLCVKSNDEWMENISWTGFTGAPDDDAAGKVIPAERMRVELNGQEINNNYLSEAHQLNESSEQIMCYFKPDWSDHAGKYEGTITISVTQN